MIQYQCSHSTSRFDFEILRHRKNIVGPIFLVGCSKVVAAGSTAMFQNALRKGDYENSTIELLNTFSTCFELQNIASVLLMTTMTRYPIPILLVFSTY